MRLIDADKLTERHCEGCVAAVTDECKDDPICGSMMWIIEEPTAYDVDKVIEGLKNRAFFPDILVDEDGSWDDNDYEMVYLDEAIRIVKGGGLNG